MDKDGQPWAEADGFGSFAIDAVDIEVIAEAPQVGGGGGISERGPLLVSCETCQGPSVQADLLELPDHLLQALLELAVRDGAINPSLGES